MDFATNVRNAEFWFTQSEQMLVASESLFRAMADRASDPREAVGFHKGSMFLLGIALENAFKGVVASKGKLEFKDGKLNTLKSFPKCRNHNLSDLAQLIKFDTNDAESELLKRLSIYTVWAGKYGTPLTECEYLEAQSYKHQRASDFDIAKTLVRKLKSDTVYDEQFGWPEPKN